MTLTENNSKDLKLQNHERNTRKVTKQIKCCLDENLEILENWSFDIDLEGNNAITFRYVNSDINLIIYINFNKRIIGFDYPFDKRLWSNIVDFRIGYRKPFSIFDLESIEIIRERFREFNEDHIFIKELYDIEEIFDWTFLSKYF
jgi:hypothetical protein